MAIGRAHTPDVAWPTLWLLAGSYLSLTISTWLALSGLWPLWVSSILNGIVLYGTYTVVHEGIHDNIVQPGSGFRWVNMTAAFIGAIPLALLIYPHRKSHMVHHTKCNTDDDPDIYARGPFGVVTFWRIPVTVLRQFNPIEQYRECRRYGVTWRDTLFSMLTYAAYIAMVAGAVAAGYGYEVLVLWFVPFFVGYSVMLVFFTWVPHYPHTEVGRYRDTRCSLWPGANVLTQGESLHLIHHMMPWVPWYRYEAVFREIRPFLEQNGAQIDGFVPRMPQADRVANRVAH